MGGTTDTEPSNGTPPAPPLRSTCAAPSRPSPSPTVPNSPAERPAAAPAPLSPPAAPCPAVRLRCDQHCVSHPHRRETERRGSEERREEHKEPTQAPAPLTANSRAQARRQRLSLVSAKAMHTRRRHRNRSRHRPPLLPLALRLLALMLAAAGIAAGSSPSSPSRSSPGAAAASVPPGGADGSSGASIGPGNVRGARGVGEAGGGGGGDGGEGVCEPPRLPEPALMRRWGCSVYHKMCVDQQQFVSYDPRHNPRISTEPIPPFDVHDMIYNWPNPHGNGDKFVLGRALPFPPVLFRVNTTQEPSADLQRPHFSACTSPLIIWQRWPYNVGEVYETSYARLYDEIQAGTLDPRLSPVMATPHGLRLPRFAHLFYGALFERPVVSLAELSARPASADPRVAPTGTATATATEEDSHGRCFEHVTMCKLAKRKDQSGGLCAAGEHLLRRFAPHLPPVADLFDPEADRDALKVVFASRPNTTGRVILNEQQLLQHCNGLDPAAPLTEDAAGAGAQTQAGTDSVGRTRTLLTPEVGAGAGAGAGAAGQGVTGGAPSAAGGGGRRVFTRVKCVAHDFGHDLLYDLSLASSIDVLVATHGAAGYHSFYMTRGSSLVEVMPYGFNAEWANKYYARMLEFEKKVFYWSIWITSARNSRPSAFEQHKTFSRIVAGREHHVVLPWPALRQHLASILQVGGDALAYRDAYVAGLHAISDELQPVPHRPDVGSAGWLGELSAGS